MIADTSDWNGALKESGNFKIITDQHAPVDLTDSLIKQGYRVLTAEAGTFDDVVSAVRDFTQFESANLVILGAHGNSKSIGDKWFYLSDAERKREGSVSIDSNHENQWRTALVGRIKGKVLLDSCGTGGSCVGSNVADVVARITQTDVIAPTDIIHGIGLNKDGNNVSVKFYGSEWYEPDPMIRNFGKPEDQPKEKEVPAYIANPSKVTIPKAPDHAMVTFSEYENYLKPILEKHNGEQTLNWTDIMRRLEGEYVQEIKGLRFQSSRHVIPDAELNQEEKNIREAKEKFIEGDIFRAKQLLDYVITADKDGVYGRRASDLKGRIDGMGNTPMAAIDRQILVLEPTASDILRAIKTLSLTEGMYGTEEENLRKAIAQIWAAQNIPGTPKTQEFKILANILMSAYAAYPDISDLTEPIENLFLRVEDRGDIPKEIRDIASGMDRLIVDIQHYDRPRSEDDTLAEELLTRVLFVDESEIINPLIVILEKMDQVSAGGIIS